MTTDLIHDRGCGPEIRGTRVTVYDLLNHFLDPFDTEAYICGLYDLTAEQVAAARAFVFNHADEVLAEHLQIEARLAEGNRPEVIKRALEAKSTLINFKEWLAKREEAAARDESAGGTSEIVTNGAGQFPTFKEWMLERQSRPAEGS